MLEIEGQLFVMPNREQVNRRTNTCIKHQVVLKNVFTKFSIFTDCCQFALKSVNAITGLNRTDSAAQKRAPHGREAFEIGDDGIRQLIKQRIKGLWCLCFGEEGIDLVEAAFKICSELDGGLWGFLIRHDQAVFLRRCLMACKALRASLVRPAAISSSPLLASLMSSRWIRSRSNWW